MATFKYGMKLGPGQLQIESDSMKQFMLMCGMLAHVEECGNCQSKNVIPHGESNSQGHQFFCFKCLDCKHELKFGQRQDAKGTLFLKHWEGWQPPFEGKRGNGGSRQQPRSRDDFDRNEQRQKSYGPPSGGQGSGAPAMVPSDDNDDIPF